MRGQSSTPSGVRVWHCVGRVAILAALLATGSSLVLPAAGAAATSCWQRVIADWSADGRVDRVYPLACYRNAVKHMPEDLRAYSSAPDDIRHALTTRRSLERHMQRAPAPRTSSLAALPAATDGTPVAVIVPAAAGFLVALSAGAWLAQRRLRHSRD